MLLLIAPQVSVMPRLLLRLVVGLMLLVTSAGFAVPPDALLGVSDSNRRANFTDGFVAVSITAAFLEGADIVSEAAKRVANSSADIYFRQLRERFGW